MHRSRQTALSIAVLLAFAIVPAAWAHSFVDHCTPDIGSTLSQPPAQLRCTFTEAIDVRQTRFSVIDARSNTVDNGDLKADPNDNKGQSIILTLNTARITGGVYTVRWQTVSADGDPTDGQFQFSVNAQPVPTITLVSPGEHSKFDQDPSDVPVTVGIANFALGQGGRRWQVYLDDNLVAQVTDGSTTTTLKGVRQGDYALKVALATDDKTIVATAGAALSVAPSPAPAATPAPTTSAVGSAPAATPVPAQSPPATTTAPSTLPTTGSNSDSWPLLGVVLLLVTCAIMTVALGRVLRRIP